MAHTIPWEVSGGLAQGPLFSSGQGGYHTYRIPALAVSRQGTLLAFAEGRRLSSGDSGLIDILLRRSRDGGFTWDEPQAVISEPNMTCGNPCPVVDQVTGTIWLLLCKNLPDGDETLIKRGQAPRTIWLTHSDDDGASWAEPVEITPHVKEPTWTWYATGPGHGIQLAGGRLLVPCDHVVYAGRVWDDPNWSHAIFSDDHGATWHLGGSAAEGTNECEALETADGALYLNSRNCLDRNRRAIAWSRDGGATFTAGGWDEALICPVCQASVTRLTLASPGGRNRVLFSNPASLERERLTVRLSYDECRTWPVARMLHEGPAAYSDLGVAADGAIYCLYERGQQHAYEEITLARFSLEWLTLGQDRL